MNNRKALKLISMLGIMLGFVACSDQPQESTQDLVTLDLTVTEPVSGELIKFEKVGGEGVQVIDSLTLGANNKAQFQVAVDEPTFYRVNLYGRQFVNLILTSQDELVSIEAEGNRPNGKATISGSADTEMLMKARKMSEKLQGDIQMLNAEFVQARSSGDMATAVDIQEQFAYLQEKYTRELKEMIWNMDESIAAIFAVSYFQDQEAVYPFLDSLSNRFQKAYPESPYTASLESKVADMRVTAIGSPAPEINLPTPEGEPLALSSLQGKYVLVDFWAAWCKPCRVENPTVVKAYNKYAAQGFEVYGVSLDRKREDWLQAIEKDGLPWKHVSDLKYWNSTAADAYNVSAIPATFLLDPQGRIIAKGLRGEQLVNKLEEIFG